MGITYTDNILGDISIHGIGKFVIESNVDWNIPNLHYITYFSENEKEYTSYCLELNTHYSDIDFQKAIQEMLRGSLEYLNSYIVKKEDMDKLIDMVGDTENEDLWALYRKCEFTLAKEKNDLSYSFIQNIKRIALKEFVQKQFIPLSINYSEITPKEVA